MNCEVRPDAYRHVIKEIVGLRWSTLTPSDLAKVASAYYFFSVQFRESLLLACEQHPSDLSLQALRAAECETDNLSPYPGIAGPGERMNHDEFMRRILLTAGIGPSDRAQLDRLGEFYLSKTRALDPTIRALSISSYEDGGLEVVFRAILLAPAWSGRSLMAFRHFLVEHIRFDSDEQAGHGALCRHLPPDDRVLPLWTAFRDLFVAAVPGLVNNVCLVDA